MPRVKRNPQINLNVIAENEIDRIFAENLKFVEIRKVSPKNTLSFVPFEREVFSTPEEHCKFEHAELRLADESRAVAEPQPWEKDAPSEVREAALKASETPELFFETVIMKDEEECKRQTEYPQRTTGWLNARSGAITASDFASAVSRNPYRSTAKFLSSKVAPSRSGFDAIAAKFAQWGTDHEEHAEEAFRLVLDKRCESGYLISHPSMFKHKDAQWIAVSPDGVLTYMDPKMGEKRASLVEYKCPAYYRHSPDYPYKKFKGGIPPQYYDQIQGTMWLMRNYDVHPDGRLCDGCYFVVWQPHAVSITFVPYSETYASMLVEKLKAFYFDRFIPSCIQQLKS